jgi:hypothetical protein
LTGGSVEGLVNGGITRAANSRLIVDDLTDRTARFARVNMLDAASQFCHISWWLISSIAVVPSAVATNNDAFEVCVCHACAGGMTLSSRGCRPSILYLRATPVIFGFSRPPSSDRLVSIVLSLSTSTQLWRRSRSFDSSPAHRGLRGMGTTARSVGTRTNLRQVAPFFCRPRCASQRHVDRAAF